MNHKCHITKCLEKIPPAKLMCSAHWRMVPKHLKQSITINYRVGQCNDKQPSLDWVKAARSAINWVTQEIEQRDMILKINEETPTEE